MPDEKLKTGWANPSPYTMRSKFHYFGDDHRSLCGRWAWVGPDSDIEEGNDNHDDNCATCRNKKAKKDEKERLA